MLTGPVILTIIPIIVLLILVFVIYLRLEKDFRRAFLFVSILVISLFLGILVNNLHGLITDQHDSITQNTDEESDTVIDDTSVVSVDDSISIEDNTDRGSDSLGDNGREDGDDSRSFIRRIIDSLSPATKPFAGKINKDYFPNSVLFWLIIIMDIIFFIFFIGCIYRPCPLWVFVIVPFVLIINSYIFYITAFFISTFFTGNSSGWLLFIYVIVCLVTAEIAVIEAALISRLTELSNKEYS